MFGRRARSGRSRPWEGTSGRPSSGNGASSLHLFWATPTGRWRSVAATIEVVEPPAVPDLHFWALQASFVDASGASAGAGHLGLQHHTPHPGATAVNWGGYGGDGAILDGSRSSLPSATANPHTRDFDWASARPYRLRIEVVGPAPDGRRTAFRGSVEDLATGTVTVVRDLWAHGDHLGSPMVWSEVFARATRHRRPCGGRSSSWSPTTAPSCRRRA